MGRLLLVVLGSGVGGGLRYLCSGWCERRFGPGFPFGTLGVNVIGSFLIVAIMQLGREKGLILADVRLLLTTGLLGGFTTYSAFSYETIRFFDSGAYRLGLLYLVVTVVSCLAAAALASATIRWLT